MTHTMEINGRSTSRNNGKVDSMLQHFTTSSSQRKKVELFPVMVGELLCCYTAPWVANKSGFSSHFGVGKRAEVCMQIVTLDFDVFFVGKMFYCVEVSCR